MNVYPTSTAILLSPCGWAKHIEDDVGYVLLGEFGCILVIHDIAKTRNDECSGSSDVRVHIVPGRLPTDARPGSVGQTAQSWPYFCGSIQCVAGCTGRCVPFAIDKYIRPT